MVSAGCWESDTVHKSDTVHRSNRWLLQKIKTLQLHTWCRSDVVNVVGDAGEVALVDFLFSKVHLGRPKATTS